MPKRVGIDKRIITYSAQVLSGEIKREEGSSLLEKTPYDKEKIEEEIAYVLKKLDLSEEEFSKAFKQKNKYFFDFYPSYYPLIKKFSKLGKVVATKIFGFRTWYFRSD